MTVLSTTCLLYTSPYRSQTGGPGPYPSFHIILIDFTGRLVIREGVPGRLLSAGKYPFYPAQYAFHKVEPYIAENNYDKEKQKKYSDFFNHIFLSFCRKAVHEELGKCGQLFFLGYINIQLFIVQPVVSIDTYIACLLYTSRCV